MSRIIYIQHTEVSLVSSTLNYPLSSHNPLYNLHHTLPTYTPLPLLQSTTVSGSTVYFKSTYNKKKLP
jgi:hypothetical protein